MARVDGALGPLPPGQHVVGVFRRFGTHLFRPIPDVSDLEAIRVGGAMAEPVDIPIARLATMARRDMVTDFHCVAGWTVPALHWTGVPFRSLYRTVIAPVAHDGVTHIRFVGIDGFRSVLMLEDALEDDVMVVDHLDELPLGGDHGGPVRLVCPSRYGYKSTKHLSAIELHTAEPAEGHTNALLDTLLLAIKPHRRARVAAEERHRHLPAWSLRWVYSKVLDPAIRSLCRIGDRRSS